LEDVVLTVDGGESGCELAVETAAAPRSWWAGDKKTP
jgi:hypothetical protein